jgi:hypothetical protein
LIQIAFFMVNKASKGSRRRPRRPKIQSSEMN